MARAYKPSQSKGATSVKASSPIPAGNTPSDNGLWSATVRWLNSLRSAQAQIPVGYEDENGFHFGPSDKNGGSDGLNSTSLGV